MTETSKPAIFARWKGVIVSGWLIAAVRFAMDWRETESREWLDLGFTTWTDEWIGLYYLMPLVLLIAAMRGAFRGMAYGRLVLGVALTALLCWGVPNAITYTVAQFKGWTHGRFYVSPEDQAKSDAGDEAAGTTPPAAAVDAADAIVGDSERAAPMTRTAPRQHTSGAKIGTGVMVGAMTTLGGFVWMFLWMNLLVYLPRRLRRA